MLCRWEETVLATHNDFGCEATALGEPNFSSARMTDHSVLVNSSQRARCRTALGASQSPTAPPR
jgi:hypothetical protein